MSKLGEKLENWKILVTWGLNLVLNKGRILIGRIIFSWDFAQSELDSRGQSESNKRETLIYFEEIVKGDNGGGFWNDTEEESDHEEQIVKSKKSRNRHDSDRSDGRSKGHHDRGDRGDLSPKQRSRPQVARYRLMNDDEEFEASPNEYSSVRALIYDILYKFY